MIPSKHPVGRIMVLVARAHGWNVTNPGEAEVAQQLELLGYTPADVRSQFHVGRYRLDFAVPAGRIDIEADGWVHTASSVRVRDSRRDSQLKGMGWTVVRIDIDGDIAAQLRGHLPPRTCADALDSG
jgi:REase_MTES_1575